MTAMWLRCAPAVWCAKTKQVDDMENPMNRAKGFSLIEVLVALVLTTIGVLGMVALQSKAVIYTSDAAARDTAVTLVNELIEIMRTHRDQLYKNKPPEQYSYTQLLTSTDIYDQDGSLKVTASCPN